MPTTCQILELLELYNCHFITYLGGWIDTLTSVDRLPISKLRQ